MAEPGKNAAQHDEVEHKVVELAEAKAGVKLRPDHRVVLTVKDLGVEHGGAGQAGGEKAGEAHKPTEESVPEKEEAAPKKNFHVQLELPDGSDYARNKSCVLEIPGHPSVEGTTNDSGELVLSVPNVTVEHATLRMLDGGAEIATWPVTLRADDEGARAGGDAANEAPPAGDAA